MVMSTHVLVTVIDPLQLGFSPDVTSSVSEHVAQSPEAVSKSESALSFLDVSESDEA